MRLGLCRSRPKKIRDRHFGRACRSLKVKVGAEHTALHCVRLPTARSLFLALQGLTLDRTGKRAWLLHGTILLAPLVRDTYERFTGTHTKSGDVSCLRYARSACWRVRKGRLDHHNIDCKRDATSGIIIFAKMQRVQRLVLLSSHRNGGLPAVAVIARAFSSTTVVQASGKPTRVCVVGSGPSGFYTAKYLLKDDADITVDILDRLPTPYGL